jgi:hypothetical protein
MSKKSSGWQQLGLAYQILRAVLSVASLFTAEARKSLYELFVITVALGAFFLVALAFHYLGI